MSDKRVINVDVFPVRLQEAMKLAGRNTYELADALSLSAATISRYANGLMTPKITTVYAAADYLGVNALWLLGYDSPKYDIPVNKKPATGEGDGPPDREKIGRELTNILRAAGYDPDNLTNKEAENLLEVIAILHEKMKQGKA